jgi:putative ABC transport system permease protein
MAPARTVARLPVLRALSGRRPAEASARRTLAVGLLFISLAIATTIGGALMEGAFSDGRLVLMMGGAVLGTLGFGACAPWLLERLEGLAARLPLAGRIAFRDTSRARSRSSPIVTAILSGLAASVAIGAWQASDAASELKFWHPALYDDQLVIFGAGAQSAGQTMLAIDGVIGGASIPKLYPADQAFVTFVFPGALHADGRLINMYERCQNCNGEFGPYQISDVAAGTPELLGMAHAEAALDDLRQGRVVLLSAEPITATTMEVVRYDETGTIATTLMTLPVSVVHAPVSGGLLPEAFLPDSVIDELGLVPGGEGGGDAPFIVEFDHDVGEAELKQASQVAAGFVDTWAELGNVPPGRQGEGWRLLLIGLVLLFALSVTGIAIALGEAESRPEQRSLLALGADPGLRRRIAAARAAVFALLAGLLAVPAGLLPVWGIFASRDAQLAIPTIEIAGAVIVLPALAIASAWLLSRPIPDWAAFRNVRPGE